MRRKPSRPLFSQTHELLRCVEPVVHLFLNNVADLIECVLPLLAPATPGLTLCASDPLYESLRHTDLLQRRRDDIADGDEVAGYFRWLIRVANFRLRTGCRCSGVLALHDPAAL